ncbi:nucleotidyltransferase family protein [Paraglaciecola aquimarina]|uniref:Nucleotidyltransferase family protein n=1 Tax=Paraglaciecola aquimarina TaxID=1235557 RepID=A0ABU3SZ76_9ALTE|nr:nucleotidyltransferase family protein [Paraglaciecola aquimarina]MDU0355319.1 nucleotidyltransferase family protein [Paraglaciecola aquimarina]
MMLESEATKQLIQLLQNDKFRLNALYSLQQINLPSAYIAAGFVRNMVWDHKHNTHTPLNDIDVIYFEPAANTTSNGHSLTGVKRTEQTYKEQLSKLVPNVNWQVKNQAFMHIPNNDAPYSDIIDAIAHWPEKETAVAVRLASNDDIEVVSAFGIARLFDLTLTHNPACDKPIFEHRIATKKWLHTWPQLLTN